MVVKNEPLYSWFWSGIDVAAFIIYFNNYKRVFYVHSGADNSSPLGEIVALQLAMC